MSSIHEQIEKSKGGKKLSVPVITPTAVKNVEEFNFRPLPYKWQPENNPFIEVHQHANIGSDKKAFGLCPEKMFGEFCPYCKLASILKDRLDKEEWKKIARKYYPSSHVYIPGIVRFSKSSEFAFLKVSHYQNFTKEILSIIQDKRLKELFKIPADSLFIKVWDLKLGLDLIVQKNEKSKSNTFETFTIKNDLKLTPAARNEEEKNIIISFLKDTPDLIKEMVSAYGASEKINQAFISQYEKYAIQFGLISSDKKSSTTEKSLPTEVSDDVSTEDLSDLLPKNESKSSDDMEDVLTAQIESNDSNLEKKSESGNAEIDLDDEYRSIMNELE